jgi:1-acyl-sn-glycerol-3-phosphate acyltransferase
MNIFRMIGPAVWLIVNLRYLTKYKKAIDRNRALGHYEEERKQITNATSSWGPRLIEHFDVDLRVEGLDNIPEEPVLFVSNHQGYADIIAFCAGIKTKQFGFVAKQALGRIPLYGPWIERIRSIFIERDDARGAVQVINSGIALLEEGFSLVVFPEGTRSLSEHMGSFKKGSLKLATKAKVPVVPVTLSGSWKVFEEKSYIQKGEVVKICIHPPIATESLSKEEQNDLATNVESIVRSKLEEWNGSI